MLKQSCTLLFSLLLAITAVDVSASVPLELAQLRPIYEKKCGEVTSECFLNECDIGLPNCHADHAILFRGEGRLFAEDVSSGLKRTCDGGSSFCGPDRESSLENLRSALDRLRPLAKVPSENREIVFVPEKEKWVYRYTKGGDDDMHRIVQGKNAKRGSKALQFMQILFLMHQNDAFLNYLESENEVVPLDPLVSFSANPNVAIGFANQYHALYYDDYAEHVDPPRLVVVSVAPGDWTSECGEVTPDEGKFLKARNCGDYNGYREAEYPVFYSVRPENYIGNYEIPAPALNAASGTVIGCENKNEYSWDCMCRRYPDSCHR